MADQVEVRVPKSVVPEETNFTVTVNFRDRGSAAASIPTTVHYRVDCLSTRTMVREWTSVSSPAAEMTITLNSTDTKIQDGTNDWERKQIMIKADTGLSTQAIGRAVFQVDNLFGIGIGAGIGVGA